MYWISLLWKNIPQLIYPALCMGCEQILFQQEEMICLSCIYHLPFTDHLKNSNNELCQQLKGKVAFQYAAAWLTLVPSGRVEQMIYQLKYNNKPAVGLFLGRLFAKHMLEAAQFQDCDYIVPIPLHRRRKSTRGYNQSECIARGISEILHIPVLSNLLVRNTHTITQTNLSRMERLENVGGIFSCKPLPDAVGKHFLVLDDVLTTGATICAAAEKILESFPAAKVSIAAIARA